MTPTEMAMPTAANPIQNSNGIMTTPLKIFSFSFVDALESSNEPIIRERREIIFGETLGNSVQVPVISGLCTNCDRYDTRHI